MQIMNILKGNKYNDNVGSVSICGADYQIVVDGVSHYFRERILNFTKSEVNEYEFINLKERVEISWQDTPIAVRKALFKKLYTCGNEFDMNLFVFGDETGKKMNDDIVWANNHMIYSRDISLEVRKNIGEFTDVAFLRKVGPDNDGYVDNIYLIDEKWQVTVHINIDKPGRETFKVEDYAPIRAGEKAFGRRVARLAKSAHISWAVAKTVGHIASDALAIQYLKSLKAVKNTITEDTISELSSNILIVKATLFKFLGEELFKAFNCDNTRNAALIADYLRSI